MTGVSIAVIIAISTNEKERLKMTKQDILRRVSTYALTMTDEKIKLENGTKDAEVCKTMIKHCENKILELMASLGEIEYKELLSDA